MLLKKYSFLLQSLYSKANLLKYSKIHVELKSINVILACGEPQLFHCQCPFQSKNNQVRHATWKMGLSSVSVVYCSLLINIRWTKWLNSTAATLIPVNTHFNTRTHSGTHTHAPMIPHKQWERIKMAGFRTSKHQNSIFHRRLDVCWMSNVVA